MRQTLMIGGLVVLASLSVLAGDEVTFYDQVGTILHNHCADCHRPGGMGPFALLTHRDVASRADDILRVVKSGQMPPWQAVGKPSEFLGDRRLTEDQKRLLEQWIAGGAPAGPWRELRLPEQDPSGWQLGEPSVVLQPAALGSRAAANLLAVDLDQGDLWVTGIELRPQSRPHHMLLWLDLPVTSPVLEVDNSGRLVRRQLVPAWLRDRLLAPAPSAFRPAERAAAIAARDRRLIGVWAADCLSQSFPEDSAMLLPAGSRLIVETSAERAAPMEIGLHLSNAPPKHPAAVVAVEAVTPRLATARNLPRQGAFQTPVDCELHAIAPHADASCREVRVNLTLPNGHSESLLWIDHWDERWERSYQYRRALQLPARSRIDVQFVPVSGEDAREMSTPALVAAQLVPLQAGDYDELVRAMQRTQMTAAREPVKAKRSWR
jgi:hypothetical protein